MPNSKVVQAELTPEASVALTVLLAHLEPGEQTLVQSTVVQGNTVADGTVLVTGGTKAGPKEVRVIAVPRSGTFTHDAQLVAHTQATSVWTTQLKPLPEGKPAPGHPRRPLWGDSGAAWPGGND